VALRRRRAPRPACKTNGDYGWPECYYDAFLQKLVLAPEYGGDGGKTIGVCANKIAPIAAFPAHWAPNAMVRYGQLHIFAGRLIDRQPSRFRSHANYGRRDLGTT
jgi:hypothetical protein